MRIVDGVMHRETSVKADRGSGYNKVFRRIRRQFYDDVAFAIFVSELRQWCLLGNLALHKVDVGDGHVMGRGVGWSRHDAGAM